MNYACTRAVSWSGINIASMVLGFVVFWPIGLVILFYILNGGDMGHMLDRAKHSIRRNFSGSQTSAATSNSAFNDYREATLRRLEEEQVEFEAFMGRLRQARDKAEFDQFMAERNRAGGQTN